MDISLVTFFRLRDVFLPLHLLSPGAAADELVVLPGVEAAVEGREVVDALVRLDRELHVLLPLPVLRGDLRDDRSHLGRL